MQVSSTDDVLAAEFRAVWDEAPPPDDIGAACFARGQAALCLSGGGCRSSTFALGVVQALASHGLLTRFHYLSTVSGGGFLGSMLSRWILSVSHAGNPGDAATTVQRELGDPASPATPLGHLRRFSNYLTPRRGLASSDTWTALALWTRNTVINWMLFLPALMSVAVVSYVYSFMIACALPPRADFLQGSVPHDTAMMSAAVLALAAILLVVATCRASLLLPSHTSDPARRVGRRSVAIQVVTPALSSAFLMPIAAAPWTGVHGIRPLLDTGLIWIGGAQAGALVLGYVAAGLVLAVQRQPIESFMHNARWWAMSSVASAVVLMLAAYGLAQVPRTWHNAVLATFGPLVVVVAQLVASTVYVGLRRPSKGAAGQTLASDLDREWLARLSAMKIRPALGWAAIAACVLLLQRVAFSSGASLQTMTLTSVFGAISGVVAVLGGKGSITSMVGTLRLPRQKLAAAAISIGTVVVIAVVLMLLFRLHQAIADWLYPFVEAALPNAGLLVALLFQAALLAFYVGLVLLFARLVNVNRFSLGGVYRNRLAKAYLGAGNLMHEPEPFTGFDARDNVRVHQLDSRAGGRRVLFHVINLALNVAKTKNLAWQERKALPFTVSPLHCGSASLDGPQVPGPSGAYVPSDHYGGAERELGMDDGEGLGISLATAMTISGAAASPNMGYHTAPATAFLMTLFNVRLGAWLPNPRLAERIKVQASGPRNSLMPFLRELAGQTNDEAPDVYLSDGGHFENLGLYEMVRRRCRFILVSDAGCDEACAFEDLGNAIRKVALDFPGVDITLEKLDRVRARGSAEPAEAFYAIGRITYPGIKEPGTLLYVKPTWIPGLPADIRAYGLQNAAFPHEPTSDQWFSESQFESYRHLGEALVRKLIEGSDDDARAFFEGLVGRRRRPVAA